MKIKMHWEAERFKGWEGEGGIEEDERKQTQSSMLWKDKYKKSISIT